MNIETPLSTEQPCRLCGGSLGFQFKATVLARHSVDYLSCADCRSLQTEPPHWLPDAYASNLADLDTGAAQRCFVNLGASHMVSRLFGLANIIDFGGGDGLHTRLLRDHGLNAHVEDAHARPGYAQGFASPDFETPDLITAFEVMEHFANPADDLAQIFARGAKAVLASTTRWHGEGADWWYLTPTTGQHIFFYSETAIALIARQHGYGLAHSGNYLLFLRPALASGAKVRLIQLLLRGRLPRLWSSLLQLRQPKGPDADWKKLEKQP